MSHGPDRRATPRYAVDLPARFWTDFAEDEERGVVGPGETARVADVSWGGLFLRCDELQPPGTTLRLQVGVTRADDTVPLRGEVAWTGTDPLKGPGMGIRLETPL